MSGLKLYGDRFSVATRSVTITLDILVIDYEFINVDVLKGMTLTPSFQKINPVQTVPVLVDGSFKLAESRAICTYLVSKFGASQSKEHLYPTILMDRAKVDEMLYYDACVVTPTFQDLMRPVLHGSDVSDSAMSKMMGILHRLNKDLASNVYMAKTEDISLADIHLFALIGTLEAVGVIEINQYQAIEIWLEKCKAAINDYDKANGEGIKRVVRYYMVRTGVAK